MKIKGETLNGKAVRKWMIDQDLDQHGLAQRLDIQRAYLSLLMNGRAALSGNVLIRLHDLTGIPLNELRLPVPPIPGVSKKYRKRFRAGHAPVKPPKCQGHLPSGEPCSRSEGRGFSPFCRAHFEQDQKRKGEGKL